MCLSNLSDFCYFWKKTYFIIVSTLYFIREGLFLNAFVFDCLLNWFARLGLSNQIFFENPFSLHFIRVDPFFANVNSNFNIQAI